MNSPLAQSSRYDPAFIMAKKAVLSARGHCKREMFKKGFFPLLEVYKYLGEVKIVLNIEFFKFLL